MVKLTLRLINAVEVVFILRSCLLMLLINEPRCKVLAISLALLCFTESMFSLSTEQRALKQKEYNRKHTKRLFERLWRAVKD